MVLTKGLQMTIHLSKLIAVRNAPETATIPTARANDAAHTDKYSSCLIILFIGQLVTETRYKPANR